MRMPAPRPLPLHLAVLTTTLASLRAERASSRSGSPVWSPELTGEAADLEREIAALDPEVFAAALEAEARRRLEGFADGVLAFDRLRGARPEPPVPVLWQDGSTRLFDYSQTKTGAPLLLVPSLINRSYILDLEPNRSLVRYLAEAGFRPFLVDWDEPGEIERGFTLTDYVANRLQGALDAVWAECGRPAGVVGYCMGGLLALALAGRNPERVGALALLATPWDFHALGGARVRLLASLAPLIGGIARTLGVLPADVLAGVFTALDPYRALERYRWFARADKGSRRAREFLALETWLNDGVALAGPVACECLEGWYVENTPLHGTWRVDGRPVRPQEVRCPSLSVVPGADRIVPAASARVLAEMLPGGTIRNVEAGHVGITAGRRARQQLYRPLSAWLARGLG